MLEWATVVDGERLGHGMGSGNGTGSTLIWYLIL